jgi:hypothetical protein
MTGRRFSAAFLRALRNEIAINDLVISVLRLPFTHSEGFLRFLCPLCGEFHTAMNPTTNLARCFRCQKNFNTIEMVMVVKNHRFIEAVRFLEPLLPSPRQTPR